MFSVRRTLYAVPRHAGGRAFVARPVTRPITRFSYSDSSSPAANPSPAAPETTPATTDSKLTWDVDSTSATTDSTPASTPKSEPLVAALPTGTTAPGKGPGEKLADPRAKPLRPKRAPFPVKKIVAKPFAKKPVIDSVKNAEGDTAEKPVGKSTQAVTNDKPLGPREDPPAPRASTSPLKNTYEATTITYASPKHHATPKDVDVPWETSFHGISTRPVSSPQFKALMRPLDEADIEVKPDGIIYLPEIKYRRRLNEAFGPMGWGMIPRGEVVVGQNIVTREYALIVDGRFVSQAQGENNYYSPEGLPSAVEGCKSNALMRCCKDLGIASELWDPRFIRLFRKQNLEEVWVEHMVTKKKRAIWFKKGQVEVVYPFRRT